MLDASASEIGGLLEFLESKYACCGDTLLNLVRARPPNARLRHGARWPIAGFGVLARRGHATFGEHSWA
jgi:hypothetical protein